MNNAFTFIKQSSDTSANWELVQIISHGTLNRIGTINASNAFELLTIGSGSTPIFVENGQIKASNSTIGSSLQPIYMTNGNLQPSMTTIGSINQPIYLNGGTITPCTGVISKNNFSYSNGVLTITIN